MRLQRALALILFSLGVSLLDTCLPSLAEATPRTQAVFTLPKSYAVFLATYDPQTGQAVGGVAGSAFFVSPTRAITAFHVLQAKMFANPHTQIWLVHEGEPAIELRASELTSVPDRDRTTINLTTDRTHLVYQVGATASLSVSEPQLVVTDGFRANSTGPALAPRADGRLTITSVPQLDRLHAEGTLLLQQPVDLISPDVNLKHAPCVQLSYQPVVGLSGGPVTQGGRVIGMNSFADPQARLKTWAVTITD